MTAPGRVREPTARTAAARVGAVSVTIGDYGRPDGAPGLLTAERVERAERQGRNPQTGEPLTIAASAGVKLSPVSSLKNLVRGR
ncbi:MAG: HU family DNA-binding protein [Actinomycetes bacterium]